MWGFAEISSSSVSRRKSRSGRFPNVDPIRLIEAVTAGVSFLAAGTIIHSSGRIQGLTTGAGIWMAGAVGVACGAGFYLIALIGMVLAVTIFVVLRRIKRYWLPTKRTPE